MSGNPAVSVVTPVYNGARFLGECIESVLAQTRGDFEYVILDNASTDDTNAIASRYADADPRIRLVRNDHLLPVIENWNAAVGQISGSTQYMKILHADDYMYPQCLERMVDLAERHPSVQIVGSLRRRGTGLQCEGLPTDREVFSGTEIARLFLRGEVFAFAPTSGMVRADLVRRTSAFYPTRYLHADIAGYFGLLDECDFGFIHEVLCFSRTHENSITTTVAERRQTLMREWLIMLREYGPRYFGEREIEKLERAHLRRYYRMLIRGAVTRPVEGFVDFHLAGLREMDRTPGPIDIVRAIGDELHASVVNPGKVVKHLRNSLVRR